MCVSIRSASAETSHSWGERYYWLRRIYGTARVYGPQKSYMTETFVFDLFEVASACIVTVTYTCPALFICDVQGQVSPASNSGALLRLLKGDAIRAIRTEKLPCGGILSNYIEICTQGGSRLNEKFVN